MSEYYYEVGNNKGGGWLFLIEESGQGFPTFE